MKAPKRTAQELEKEVYTHHAKTVYFNGLWKDFLTKATSLVGAMAVYQSYHMTRQAEFELHFGLAYEFLTVVIAVLNLMFLHRASTNPLLVFKAVFSVAMIQFAWFAVNTYNLQAHNIQGDLKFDQLPLGSMCFFVTWAADRYMLRNEETAERASKEVRDLKKKLR